MSGLIDRLSSLGCDLDKILDRFMNDEQFYSECYTLFIYDENFSLLGNYITTGKVKEAFESAHTLKGVISNMGITPLYNIINGIVEPLRNGSLFGVENGYNNLMAEYAKFRALVK